MWGTTPTKPSATQPDLNFEIELDDFFYYLLDAYQHVAQKHGISRQNYRLARHPICIEMAGRQLFERETRALEHLASPSESEPRLTIKMFDHFDFNSRLPEIPNGLLTAASSYQQDFGDISTPVYFHDTPHLRLSWMDGEHGSELNLLDKEQNIALVICRRKTSGRTASWIHASPFRTVFSWWLSSKGSVVAHAACVGTKEGCVLLCGNGGSGKSTTAALCLQAGLLYSGDDSVVLTNDTYPAVSSMYCSNGLRRNSRLKHLKLPGSSGPFTSFRSQKNLYLIAPDDNSLATGEQYLRGIFCLQVTDEDQSLLTPCNWIKAISTLAPSTLCQFSGDSQSRLTMLSQITGSVPVFDLMLGADLQEIPQLIRNYLTIGQREYRQ